MECNLWSLEGGGGKSHQISYIHKLLSQHNFLLIEFILWKRAVLLNFDKIIALFMDMTVFLQHFTL